MAPSGRRNTKNSRRSDAVLGFAIPGFFLALAAYQEVHDGSIDKYVIGALLVFGLGALGWRIDILLEKIIESRSINKPAPPEVTEKEPPKQLPQETEDAAHESTS